MILASIPGLNVSVSMTAPSRRRSSEHRRRAVEYPHAGGTRNEGGLLV